MGVIEKEYPLEPSDRSFLCGDSVCFAMGEYGDRTRVDSPKTRRICS